MQGYYYVHPVLCKKLSYHAASVEILSSTAQLYEKSHMKKFAASDLEDLEGHPKWRDFLWIFQMFHFLFPFFPFRVVATGFSW